MEEISLTELLDEYIESDKSSIGKIKAIKFLKPFDVVYFVITIRIEDLNCITTGTINILYTPKNEHLNKDDLPKEMKNVEQYIYNLDDIIQLAKEFGIDEKLIKNPKDNLLEIYMFLVDKLLGKKVVLNWNNVESYSDTLKYWIKKLKK